MNGNLISNLRDKANELNQLVESVSTRAGPLPNDLRPETSIYPELKDIGLNETWSEEGATETASSQVYRDLIKSAPKVEESGISNRTNADHHIPEIIWNW